MRRLQEGYGTDFSIKCIGGIVNCHKFILASRVPYFKRRFHDNWSNKTSIICKVPLDHMAYLIDYIYTAACSIPVCELDDVRKVGEQLKCTDFVNLLDHEFEVMTEWSRLKPTVGGTIRQIDIYGDKGELTFLSGSKDLVRLKTYSDNIWKIPFYTMSNCQIEKEIQF